MNVSTDHNVIDNAITLFCIVPSLIDLVTYLDAIEMPAS